MSIWWWIACCTVREDGESGPQSLHHQQDKPCRPHRQWATVTLMILYWVFVSTQVFCMMSMWRWFACCTDGEGRESGPWSLHHQQDQPGGLGWQWATVPGADHWRETQGKIAFKQCMDGWLIGSLVCALDCSGTEVVAWFTSWMWALLLWAHMKNMRLCSIGNDQCLLSHEDSLGKTYMSEFDIVTWDWL